MDKPKTIEEYTRLYGAMTVCAVMGPILDSDIPADQVKPAILKKLDSLFQEWIKDITH